METPKTTIRIPEDEKQLFQRAAEGAKMTLAAWLRLAGREQVRRDPSGPAKR
jgi:hypothetical protein